MRSTLYASVLAVALATPVSVGAADPAPGEFAFSGDARMGYFGREREDRNGSRSDESDWRIRVRPGVLWQVTPTLSAKARFAGRYSSDDSNDNHYEFFTSIPQSDGLGFGDSTIDELNLRYKAGNWDVKVGRMQTSFELEGIAKKSLSRNDSPNTDITWTDGIHARYGDTAGWNYHVIVQRSEDDGPTTVRRSPLAFTESASHATYYFGMERKDPKGRFLQIGWDLTYIPSALRTDGSAAGRIDDYLGIAGRMALQWSLAGAMRFVWAGEAGYAPYRQTDRRRAASAGFRRCERAGVPDLDQSRGFRARPRRRVRLWSGGRRLAAVTRLRQQSGTAGTALPVEAVRHAVDRDTGAPATRSRAANRRRAQACRRRCLCPVHAALLTSPGPGVR
ncbi:hypothetical protein [Methyloversatilis sp.]|uniref:hypothetical protein n=1 Tax=Methyloversatilis sp. TaxID=2569862 RepID=UPI0027B99A80|nr:hypothetical protein [Methyloversatilis sp.]